MSISRRLDKQNMVQSYGGLCTKVRMNILYINMGKSEKHEIQKKNNMKSFI